MTYTNNSTTNFFSNVNVIVGFQDGNTSSIYLGNYTQTVGPTSVSLHKITDIFFFFFTLFYLQFASNNYKDTISTVDLDSEQLPELEDIDSIELPEPKKPNNNRAKHRERVLKSVFKPAFEKDIGQDTINPYILAARHFKSEEELNLCTFNSILAYHNISITQEEFDIIKGLEPVRLPFPLTYGDPNVISVVGSVTKNKKHMVTRIYVLTLKKDGRQYVGRSVNVATRLRAYTGAKAKKSKRSIDMLITILGPSAFNLVVHPVPITKLALFSPVAKANIILIMEQFFILEKKSVLNDMLVVGGDLTKYSINGVLRNASSITGCKPLYVYNKEKTILLYYDSSHLKFATDIGISTNSIWSNKSKGTPLFGTYFFREKPIEGAITNIMTLEEMQSAIKALCLSNSGSTHPVTLTDLLSQDRTVLNFNSKRDLRIYTLSLGRPVGKVYMTKLPCTHNGWLVEAAK